MNQEKQVERLAEMLNKSLHPDMKNAAPALGIAEKGSHDQAWKAGMTRALVDVVREQKDAAELDEEIARFEADMAREERQKKQKNQVSTVMRTKTGHRLTPEQKFWKFKNLASNQAELLLYGEIQSERSWLDDEDSSGVYADEFVQDLKDLGDVSQITCRINSIGGDIFAAIAIYTQLKTHAARIVCIIDGLAASAATLIVMAGDEIQMPIGAMLMIHDPAACLFGGYTADELGENR